MRFEPRFLPLAIGSMPHTDPEEASRIIMARFKDIPFWPQLPRRSFKESMYAQFSERLPGTVIDTENKRIYVDTSRDLTSELEACYEHYLADDSDYFAISKDYAAGFYALLALLPITDSPLSIIKGQVTGPISFGLTVTDEKKRSILYDVNLADALVKVLAMKAKWQIRQFKAKNPNLEVIIFIDEPYLVSVGSAFVSLKREEVVSKLNEVIEAVHSEGALAGVHCCGNTDWPILLETNVNILSFDAYDFFDSILLYPENIKQFLEKNGVLAWGITPTSDAALKENADSLTEKVNQGIALLQDKGISKEDILKLSLITPSCGTGSLSPQLAERIFELTIQVSHRLRSEL